MHRGKLLVLLGRPADSSSSSTNSCSSSCSSTNSSSSCSSSSSDCSSHASRGSACCYVNSSSKLTGGAMRWRRSMVGGCPERSGGRGGGRVQVV